MDKIRRLGHIAQVTNTQTKSSTHHRAERSGRLGLGRRF
jgi:hypothetical protein